MPIGNDPANGPNLDDYDLHLMTAVVQKAEKAGKEVKPLILPTNNPLHAILSTAKAIGAQEVVVGASNKYTAQEQMDQMSFYWIQINPDAPLTIRILGRNWDVHADLNGGNRIPRISERKARSVAELRAAGVGVDRVLFIHSDTPEGHDLFEAVLTMLDPQVGLTIAELQTNGHPGGSGVWQSDLQRAEQLHRDVETHTLTGSIGMEVVRMAREQKQDLIIVPLPTEGHAVEALWSDNTINYILRHAPCRVFIAAPPIVPEELEEQPKTS